MAYTTINKSSLHMNTKLYTGTGSSNSVTGVGFQPDMTWFKHRNGTSEHNIYDAVRGATKRIIPNDNSAEGTQSNGLSAFGSDGFTVVDSNATNLNNGTYASWNWLAGTTASGATTGSGTAKTYSSSSNSTAGFSIVKYTGNGTAGHTVPHGCGSAPSMVIFKQLDASRGWGVYHKSLGVDKIIYLDENILPQTASPNTQFLNNTAPSSSVVSLGTWNEVNINDASYVAYCFAEKQGYSKFGSYTANGNTDGTFVYTGFKPKFILMKSADITKNWFIIDDKRSASGGNNVNSTNLAANISDAEWNNDGWGAMDLLSNGFKLRNTDTNKNSSGTYIYMAFGQSLVGTNGVTAKAR